MTKYSYGNWLYLLLHYIQYCAIIYYYRKINQNIFQGDAYSMIKSFKRKLITAIMISTMMVGSIMPTNVSADASKVVTLGADLTEAQKTQVLEFFNVDESQVLITTVNNKEERQYLEGLVSDAVIGTHTLSCCYINPTTEGGIQVKTANLNWVTDTMLANALVTAGVENCQVIATAPFEVSGTGALTGILKSYELASDEVLDEDKKEVATQEVVISAELTDDNTQDEVTDFINDLKTKVMNGDMSTDDIMKLITDKADEYGVSLTEDQKTKLQEWLNQLQTLDYDVNKVKKSIDQLNDFLNSASDTISTTKQNTSNAWQRFCHWVSNLFSSIFGGSKDTSSQDTTDDSSNIFDDVNTNIFKFDTSTDTSTETTN